MCLDGIQSVSKNCNGIEMFYLKYLKEQSEQKSASLSKIHDYPIGLE
jgi:hypothetical protein